MSNIDDLFPSKYLKASDVAEADLTVTISHVKREKMKAKDGTEEEKPCLYFHEVEKGIVLNKTNAKVIAQLYGSDYTQWAGKKITLYSAEVDAFGETKEAIRVRSKVPMPAAPVNTDPTEGLYTNTSTLKPATVANWTALVKEAQAAGIVMNWGLDETDNLDENGVASQLRARVAAIKAEIERRNKPEIEF